LDKELQHLVQSTVLCGVFQHAPDSAAKRFETIRVFVQEALQLSIAVDVCDASVRVWGLLPATPTCCMLMPWQQSAQVHAVLTVQGGRIVTAFLATSGRGRRYLREYLLQVLTCMYVCVIANNGKKKTKNGLGVEQIFKNKKSDRENFFSIFK